MLIILQLMKFTEAKKECAVLYILKVSFLTAYIFILYLNNAAHNFRKEKSLSITRPSSSLTQSLPLMAKSMPSQLTDTCFTANSPIELVIIMALISGPEKLSTIDW